MAHSTERTSTGFAALTEIGGVVGRIALLRCPGDPRAVDELALARLHPVEAEIAQTTRGWGRHDFIAGRLAARMVLGASAGPVLRGEGGAPAFPTGWSGSITHKRTLAAALVLAGEGLPSLGVDIESLEAPARTLERRVASPSELARLPEHDRQLALVATFALKEAIFKAIWPRVRRFVAFREAEVWLDPQVLGVASVELRLAGNEGPFVVDARVDLVENHVLASVALRYGLSTLPAGAR